MNTSNESNNNDEEDEVDWVSRNPLADRTITNYLTSLVLYFLLWF